jgi:hypothetical protein
MIETFKDLQHRGTEETEETEEIRIDLQKVFWEMFLG